MCKVWNILKSLGSFLLAAPGKPSLAVHCSIKLVVPKHGDGPWGQSSSQVALGSSKVPRQVHSQVPRVPMAEVLVHSRNGYTASGDMNHGVVTTHPKKGFKKKAAVEVKNEPHEGKTVSPENSGISAMCSASDSFLKGFIQISLIPYLYLHWCIQ